jgi:excisionase family DNA binding protein
MWLEHYHTPLPIMSELYEIPEAAKAMNVHEDTIRKWIKKGAIKYEEIEGIYLIPHAELMRVKSIVQTDKRALSYIEMRRVGIPHYKSLCAQGEFDTVARDLGLPEPPKDTRECYSMVYQVLRKRMYKDTPK